MPQDDLSKEELEELSYYDFMGYMDVPFFNIGGVGSIDRLAELCEIRKNSKVLVIGCGTGGNSCYLAQTYKCRITGIDIAQKMIQKAQRLAKELNLTDNVTFQLGDAYNLKFPSDSFDVVLTVFVSQFLDKQRAFLEFVRVLKPKGHLGINEMYKADEIPPEAIDNVREGEKVFQELTELPFKLNSVTEWQQAFEAKALTNIVVEVYPSLKRKGVSLKIVKEFGGWRKLIGTLGKMLLLAAKSKKIRSRFSKISKGKGLLLRDKVATKYIGYILVVGEKS
ncbi:MAG: class I SAM-dependent methyltransferase [Candidatus Bathyarchaeota archaeon]|nr:class I SAM-dependent methyltransferase [Candidatus Bathyarchaeota archaeon]